MFNYSRKTRSKYGNKKVEFEGIKFDSLGEKEAYCFYLLKQEMGQVRDVTAHKDNIYLTDAKILYKPDFSYTEVKSGLRIYVDYKGYETDVFKIKKRLWLHYGPGLLHICAGRGLAIHVVEVISPKKDYS